MLTIYTWWEIWLVASIPTLMVGTFALFSYLIQVNNTVLRSASIWVLLIGLMTAGAMVDAARKQRTK